MSVYVNRLISYCSMLVVVKASTEREIMPRWDPPPVRSVLPSGVSFERKNADPQLTNDSEEDRLGLIQLVVISKTEFRGVMTVNKDYDCK